MGLEPKLWLAKFDLDPLVLQAPFPRGAVRNGFVCAEALHEGFLEWPSNACQSLYDKFCAIAADNEILGAGVIGKGVVKGCIEDRDVGNFREGMACLPSGRLPQGTAWF